MDDDASREIRQTRAVFFFLCCFVVTQVYTVPILPIGPWALWPSLPDLVFVGMAVAWAFTPRPAAPLSDIRRKILVVFTIFTVFACGSYVVFTVLGFNLNSQSFGANRGFGFGIYECMRMIQVLLLVCIGVSIPFTPYRINILRLLITIVAWVVCITVIATYLGIVTTAQLAPHLPTEEVVAGAWWHYLNNFNTYGLGAISYTHAAVAAHILLLTAVAVHLGGNRFRGANAALLITAILATFVTGSRAGLAAMLLAAGMWFLMQSPRWVINLGMGIVALVLMGTLVLSLQPSPGDSESGISALLERQKAILSPTESENLVGREAIWAGRLNALNQEPLRWVIGWGFGSSPDTGPGLSPHMMPLQIIVEMGLIVLAAVMACFGWVLVQFWKIGGRERILFWALVALLLSALTQETFYPTPNTGGFLGLFMILLLVVLSPLEAQAREEAASRRGTHPQRQPALQFS